MISIARRAGVTLAEILVVLAIIAALTVISFPVFARAREGARQTSCISNLKQIGLSLSLYRADYDGIDPAMGVRMTHAQMGLPFQRSANTFFNIYIKNIDVLFCPSFRRSNPHVGSSYDWGIFDSEYTDPSRDWEGIAAARGMDYPCVDCSSHNVHKGRLDQSANELLRFHVLRIDGRVSVRLISPAEDNDRIMTF